MCGRHAAVQFGAAQGGSAAEPTLGGFCQLVRIVRRRRHLRHFAMRFHWRSRVTMREAIDQLTFEFSDMVSVAL